MNPEIGTHLVRGWALATKDGLLFLYSGNANAEYRNMHLDSFGNSAFCDCQLPLVFTTKWEASQRGKVWNDLVNSSIKGWVSQNGRPLPCISRDEKVHPVKVQIGIETIKAERSDKCH